MSSSARPSSPAATVDREGAIELLASMLAIPSPSGREAALAAYLAKVLRSYGYLVDIDNVGNVVGSIRRGPGPTVMMLSHLDTAGEMRPVRFDGLHMYGRGAVDAKGPLAAMVCAGALARDFNGTVIVVGVVEEETVGSRGAEWIRRAHPVPDAVIVGEASGASRIVVGYKGKLDLTYRVRCAATHPTNPIPKATELAADAWRHLLDILGPRASHAAFGTPSATLLSNVGDMVAATAHFSIRTPPEFDAMAFVAELRARVAGAGDLDVLGAVTACRRPRTDPVVQALWRTIRAHGQTPSAVLKTATSDMNMLAELWDVPMATYGPGDSRLDHGDDEHVSIDEFLRSIAVLRDTVCSLATAQLHSRTAP